MGIRSTWNTIETVLNAHGFPLMDAGEVPQARRCTMRIVEISGEQATRGAVGSNLVRLLWRFEIMVNYDASNDKRIERKVAEDAEDLIGAVYGDSNMPKSIRFAGASIERNTTQGTVSNIMRFDVQDQTAL